jgi:hypothetical protein
MALPIAAFSVLLDRTAAETPVVQLHLADRLSIPLPWSPLPWPRLGSADRFFEVISRRDHDGHGTDLAEKDGRRD